MNKQISLLLAVMLIASGIGIAYAETTPKSADTIVNVNPLVIKSIDVDFTSVNFGNPTAGTIAHVVGDTTFDSAPGTTPTIRVSAVNSITISGTNLISQTSPTPLPDIPAEKLSVNSAGTSGNLGTPVPINGLVSDINYAMNFDLDIPTTASGQYRGTITIAETV